jgi:hypothetical protein
MCDKQPQSQLEELASIGSLDQKLTEHRRQVQLAWLAGYLGQYNFD